MKLVFTEAEQNETLHILRNPHGYSEDKVRQARLDAAELIERWQDAYENMRDFALDKGLNVTAQVTL